ncbi:N-acetyltransferase family protein [Deinococcus sp. A31D244]|uniref:GNAT family N-acetyltransferase n=1 Tax=Deinococcus sp. A31D244 TaxID=3397675 RepID=UPI0039E0BD51
MTAAPFTLRPATDADHAALADLMTAVNPRHPLSTAALDHHLGSLRGHPLGLHVALWIAEATRDGQPALLGVASVMQFAGMYHPDRYHAEVGVHPAARGQGVGRALAATLEDHLRGRGAREVLAGAYEDDPDSLAFLNRREFREVMRFFDNVLNLADFDPHAWAAQRALPAGVRAVTYADLCAQTGEDAARDAYYRGFQQARADVPRTSPATPVSPEDFRQRLQAPHFLPGGVLLAVTEGGEVAALSELELEDGDPHRLNTGLTGTTRAWRRQGLALALKLRALDLARDLGAREVWTGNATTNAPMLALNDRLGFRPRVAWVEMQRGRADG